jgi:polyphosphate kinase
MSTKAVKLKQNVESGGRKPMRLPRSLRHRKQLLLNRELSWLEFNSRVLEEALNPRHPLLERLKFLAIFSSNLDEFFMVRVSGLKEALEAGALEPSPDGMTPAKQLKEISTKLRPMIELQTRCLQDEIFPKLASKGVVIKPYRELTKREKSKARNYFLEKVFPVLTPQAVDPGHPFPFISNGSLNLGLIVEPPGVSKKIEASARGTGSRFARIKLPPSVPMLVPIDERQHRFTLLGSLIAANTEVLFPEMRLGRSYLFRVTRDADFEIKEDEASDLLRTIQQHLRRRRFGQAVRLEVSSQMPGEMVQYLTDSLSLAPEDVYVIDGPLNIPDLMPLYDLDSPELKDTPLQMSVPAPLRERTSLFESIKRQDVLLHHPYSAYSTVLEFIKMAAADPDVLAIKICLYRTGRNSPIVQALIEASQQGKQVAALVELRARFDEESNIEWARRLEEAGVHVVYGLVGLKTHCKLTLVARREGESLKRYVHLATGNYNPITSKTYTDLGVLTADEELATDATNLFNYLTGFSKYSKYRCLLVAPINLKKRLTLLIQREADLARKGRAGRIIAKINSLTDIDIIRALYAASQAGVSIDLIVRGVCILRPGLAGISENIRVRSIVGRFLEHSRIFYFGNDGNQELFIGSADLMYRNLNHRVEVLTPIKDQKLKTHLRDVVLGAYLKDNVNARCLQSNGTYEPVQIADGEKRFDCQLNLATAGFTSSGNNITLIEGALSKSSARQECLPLVHIP